MEVNPFKGKAVFLKIFEKSYQEGLRLYVYFLIINLLPCR